MPVTVYRAEDEPIIIATFNGQLTAELMDEMYSKTCELITKTDDVVYRIADLRHIVIDFKQAAAILTTATQGRAGSTTDPRIHPIMLGDNQWVRFAHKTMLDPQYGGIEVPVFATLSEAMHYIRIQRKRTTSEFNSVRDPNYKPR